jgi:hypothetical protein
MFGRSLVVARLFLLFPLFLFFLFYYIYYIVFRSYRRLVKEAVDVPHRVAGVFRSFSTNSEQLVWAMRNTCHSWNMLLLEDAHPPSRPDPPRWSIHTGRGMHNFYLPCASRNLVSPRGPPSSVLLAGTRPDGLKHQINVLHRVALHSSATARHVTMQRYSVTFLQRAPRAGLVTFIRDVHRMLTTACDGVTNSTCGPSSTRLWRATRSDYARRICGTVNVSWVAGPVCLS